MWKNALSNPALVCCLLEREGMGHRQFLEQQLQNPEEIDAHAEDLGKLTLKRATELYFGWKSAKSSATTIQRERRIRVTAVKARQQHGITTTYKARVALKKSPVRPNSHSIQTKP
jgi:hypothetical protein